MKKLCVIFLLILVLSILFSACGNFNNSQKLENIKMELIGGYFEGGTDLFTRTYSFRADGTYYGTHTTFLGMNESTGTYEVTENAIILTSKGGSISELTYTYNSDNGKLILYFNNDVALTK